MDSMLTKSNQLVEALVLSTHTMGYGVIKSLGIMRVPITAVYYNHTDMGYLSKYVKESIKSPHPEKNEDDFVELLIKIGKRKNRPILIPANDETLVPVAKFRSDLERYFIVACPEYNTMLNYISKENTYKIAEEIGIPIPKTYKPESLDDLILISKQIDFPCIVKPMQSHLYYGLFKRKMLVVNDLKEMEKEYNRIIENGLGCVIQEYIPGDERQGYNFNSYRYSDSSVIQFMSNKIRYSEGGIGIPTCVISTPNIDVVSEQGLKLLNYLSYTGYSCIEFKFDSRDGKYKLMEMNGRHNRSTLLALKCGINFPWIEYADLTLNKKFSKIDYKTEIYWIDFYRDLESLPKRLIKEKYSVISFFKPYLSKKVFSEISFTDLKPTFKRFYDAVTIIISKIFK